MQFVHSTRLCPGTMGPLGAHLQPDGSCLFRVWAPLAKTVEVEILSPKKCFLPLEREEHGYFSTITRQASVETTYFYRLNGERSRPDPASRFQPETVHGPSQVIDPHFGWEDEAWQSLPIEKYVIYELHVGTFTPQGTFEAITPRLKELAELGITAIELMPVAQFPGARNWGYDGVYPFAVQNSYGGPQGLKQLVQACHRQGLAVILDVVYNHLGPEGNYLWDFAPYFTDRYRTPWGQAVNFDGEQSDHVRHFFIQNALHWLFDFHIDALRLDALHAVYDFSAHTFLEELAEIVHRQAAQKGRKAYLFAESDRNDPRLIHSNELGGVGLDSHWGDDFHHALHTLLTGEKKGYYQDFGEPCHLELAYRQGFVYTGQYSTFRSRRHGAPLKEQRALSKFVFFSQNHDQIGNRMMGERLSSLVDFKRLKCAGLSTILAPALPMFFMGEEYGETAPFLYFISHGDQALIEAVREGRRQEFAAFHGHGEPLDPQDEKTFQRCTLNWNLKEKDPHRTLERFYQELLKLRHQHPAFSSTTRTGQVVTLDQTAHTIWIEHRAKQSNLLLILHLHGQPEEVRAPATEKPWKKILETEEKRWLGSGEVLPDMLQREMALRLLPWTASVYTV